MIIQNNRIAFLDGLRGVAIFMVVLFHAYARYPQIVPYGNKYSSMILAQYGWLGVYLFFMISGFVILMTLEKTSNFFQFMAKRWLRLFPAMLVVSILVFATARAFFPERPAGIPVLKDLLPGLTFIEERYWIKFFHSPQGLLEGTFWSLFVEVKFYAIFGVVFFLFFVNAAIAVLMGLFVCYVFNVPLADHFSAEHMGWFASGALYYRFYKLRKMKWLVLGFSMALLSVALLRTNLDAKFMAVGVVLFFSLAIISQRVQSMIASRFLLFLGFVSYPLYLVHENMMVAMIVKSGQLMPFMPGFLLPIIPVVFVVSFSWLMAKYAEPGVRTILRSVSVYKNI